MNLFNMSEKRLEVTKAFMERHNLKLSQHNIDNMRNTQLEWDLKHEFEKNDC